MNLITGGDWKNSGNFYRLYLALPKVVWKEVHHLRFGKQQVKKINLETKFVLTANRYYCNIEISVLGIGLGLEIHSRGEGRIANGRMDRRRN